MRRLALLLCVLLALLLAPLGWAQTEDQSPSDQGSTAELAPDEGDEQASATLPQQAVAELARAVSTRLGESGSIPEWGRVTLSRGDKQRLSAADMFLLFCQAAQGWYRDGHLPQSISLKVGAVDPPLLDPQDAPQSHVDLEQGREVHTDQFLSFASETLRWTEQYQRVPTAVWVGGERLSAAEYLGGLAICIEYAYYSGQLDDTLFLPAYSPPLSWEEHTNLVAESSAEQAGEEPAGEGEEAAPVSRGMTPPLLDASTSAPRVAKPKLSLIPSSGSKITGTVDLVVSYSGPPASFISFSIDGKTRAIMNTSPYGYRWNTSEVAPGKHQVTARAFGEGSVEVAGETASYVVVAPKPAKSAQPAPTPAKAAPAPLKAASTPAKASSTPTKTSTAVKAVSASAGK